MKKRWRYSGRSPWTLTLPNGRMKIGSRLDLRWNLTPSLWSGPGAHAASRKHRLKNSYP